MNDGYFYALSRLEKACRECGTTIQAMQSTGARGSAVQSGVAEQRAKVLALCFHMEEGKIPKYEDTAGILGFTKQYIRSASRKGEVDLVGSINKDRESIVNKPGRIMFTCGQAVEIWLKSPDDHRPLAEVLDTYRKNGQLCEKDEKNADDDSSSNPE